MPDGVAVAYGNAILNYIAGRGAPTAIADVWVKLHIGDPGSAGTANPATETTRLSPAYGTAASAGSITNDGAVSWTNYPTGETLTHISIWDASTAGNFLAKKQLTASKSPQSGDTVTLNTSSLTITITTA